LAQDDGPHSDSDIEIASVVLPNLDAATFRLAIGGLVERVQQEDLKATPVGQRGEGILFGQSL